MTSRTIYKGVHLFLALLFISASMLGGCGSAAPAVPASTEPESIEIEQGRGGAVQENVYSLLQSTTDEITYYDPVGGDIIIPADAPGADQIQVGQVIVGGTGEQTPYGLLRRVVSIEEETVYLGETADASGRVLPPLAIKQLIIHTIKATLEELFKRAQIKDTKELSYGMLSSNAGLDYDPITNSIIVYVNKKLTDPNGAEASLNGKVYIKPRIDFDIQFDNGLKYAEFRNTAAIKSQVDLTAKETFKASKEELIYELDFEPQTVWVKGLPIVYHPVVGIYVGASGVFSTEITFRAEHEATFERSYIYNNGTWYQDEPEPIWNPIEFSGPELTIKYQARAYVKPRLDIIFYELVGLYAEAEFYLQLDADPGNPSNVPWWVLNAGLDITLGFKFEIFTDELPKGEWTLHPYEKELARAEVSVASEPTEPPPPTQPPQPPPIEPPQPPPTEPPPQAGTGNENILIVYDNTSAFVINLTQGYVRVPGLVFNRIDNQGNITASYQADTWGGFYSYDPVLPGYCLRIALPHSATTPACTIQVNYETSQDTYHFWRGTSTGSQFQVLQNGALLQTCEISAGSCRVYVPQP